MCFLKKRTLKDKSHIKLLSWCFKPNPPHRIILGVKENLTKKCKAERAGKAEIRPREEGEKAESCRENLCNEIHLKGP